MINRNHPIHFEWPICCFRITNKSSWLTCSLNYSLHGFNKDNQITVQWSRQDQLPIQPLFVATFLELLSGKSFSQTLYAALEMVYITMMMLNIVKLKAERADLCMCVSEVSGLWAITLNTCLETSYEVPIPLAK